MAALSAALAAWLWSHKHVAADVVIAVLTGVCLAFRRTPHAWLFGATLPEVLLALSLVAHHFAPAVTAAWAWFAAPFAQDD